MKSVYLILFISEFATELVWIFIIGATLFAFLFATKPVCTVAINDMSFKDDNKIKKQGWSQFWIGLGASIGPAVGGYLGNVTMFSYYYMFPFVILLICACYLYQNMPENPSLLRLGMNGNHP